MKITRKNIVIAAAAAVLILLLGRACSGPGSDQTAELMTAQAERGTLTVTVHATGEMLAKEANKIVPKVKRGTVLESIVEEGARVVKGQEIAQFSTEEIDNQISDLEARVAERELQVISARTDYEIQMIDSSNSLKAARQAVDNAEMELKKFTEGDEPNDLRDARLKIDTSVSKQERSVRKYREAQDLLKDGFITEDQVEEERIAMETAQVEAESARIRLQVLEQYDLPLRRSKAESTLEKARADLEKTIKKNQVEEQRKVQQLDNAIRQRDRAIEELQELVEERSEYAIFAPTDGVVNYGDPSNPWRRQEIQAGVTINPGEVLMTIPDLSAMQAHINVSEADVDKVADGQKAAIYVEAVGRTVFNGVVERVAEVANPGRWVSSDVKQFRVQIDILDGNGLRPGYSCEAEITVDAAENVLMLPIQAVFREGDAWVVHKGRSSRVVKVPVEIGRASQTHVEINSGLSEGDTVLMNPPEEEEG